MNKNMIFNAFFIKCSQSESNEIVKRKLKNLTFGIGGLIFTRGNVQYLSIGNGEFRIPDMYTEKDKLLLMTLLQPDTIFDEIARKIYHQQQIGTKKSEKIRIIIDKILNLNNISINKAKDMYVCIFLAILLKLIDSNINDINPEVYTLNYLISKTKQKK